MFERALWETSRETEERREKRDKKGEAGGLD
jgi:hypothetical protein